MDSLWRHSWRIQARQHPVRVRFSIGIGSLSTPLNTDLAIGMDGPAFHAARQGIELLKESGFYYTVHRGGVSREPELRLANAALDLMSGQMRSWQKNRYTILHRIDEGWTVREIAERLKISETAVYKNRKEGNLEVILAITRSITDLIHQSL